MANTSSRDGSGGPGDIEDLKSLAEAAIKSAEADLSSPNAKHRSSAYYFFTKDTSYLGHWCAILGIAPHEVRFRLREELKAYTT